MRSILEHLPGGVALAADSQADGFAFAAARRRAWPLPHAESFISPLSPSGVPAAAGDVSAAGARRFLASLLMPLVLRNVPVQHTAVQALLSAAQHRHVLKKWQRAALDVSGSFDTWLAENFDHKRRKELKRLRARLAEQGKLELRTLRAGEDVMPFADALLALEASGWKGQRGTALATDPKLAEALRQGLIQMHRLGRLRFWMLVLDGKPVAA
ncbi:MAG: GNAT family N-acetyltransferase, partial [Hyphomicrobiales bacterium]